MYVYIYICIYACVCVCVLELIVWILHPVKMCTYMWTVYCQGRIYAFCHWRRISKSTWDFIKQYLFTVYVYYNSFLKLVPQSGWLSLIIIHRICCWKSGFPEWKPVRWHETLLYQTLHKVTALHSFRIPLPKKNTASITVFNRINFPYNVI